VLLEGLERFLNRRLAESTAARGKAAALEGLSLELVVQGTGLAFVLSVEGGEYRARPAGNRVADASLRATPLGFLELSRSSSAVSLKRADAALEGKIHVAEAFADALGFVRPDAEAMLADWIGDMAAHEVARLGRAGFDWLKRAAQATELNVAEFLTEEERLLARSAELRTFAEQVDRARDQTERVAQRIERLGKRARPAS
jgi:ubiquinone biosynthesis protein UbiJ